ncbi:MAG: site-2 protease family protein [Patescibacteria group bacterium]|jgi:regulator of sigma E protease|nr:site-2 protease family protein [Patescibacteria group bacterium]
MWLVVLGIVLFILLIILHEYGHFLVAKRNGVDVEEFGVGFPPKIYGRKLGKGIFEGYYTVNLLPLGGFVRLKGEHDADKAKGSFGSVGTKAKLRIMLAGVAVNFVAALVVFTILAWIGMPQVVPNQFTVPSDTKVLRDDFITGLVVSDSPAYKSGLTSGDIIRTFGPNTIYTQEDIRTAAEQNAGQIVEITYERNGELKTTMSTINTTEQAMQAGEKLANEAKAKGRISEVNQQTIEDYASYFGLAGTRYQLNQSTWSAPVVAVGLSGQFSWLTLKAVGTALANLAKAFVGLITLNANEAKQDAAKAGENVAGPVGIFAILQQGSDLGFQFVLFVVGVLSLTLAIMNALPIPALDGGRAFVMLTFRALKKPLSADLEDRIHGTGFAILMLLFVVIVIVDVNRFY